MDNKEYICNKLKEMNIEFHVINHKAIFSEKETNLDEFDNNIVIGKNLFLRNDKKTKYYLFSLPLSKKANLSELASLFGEKRFSFANEEELKKHLNITPGSVSYLNVITADKNNANFKDVTYIIDRELLKAEKIGFHPSDNTATIVTIPHVIIDIYEKYNLEYNVIEI